MLRPARWTSILAAVAAQALFACGSPGSFEGTIHGMTLNVKESFFVPQKDGNGNLEGLVLLMSDATGFCEAFKAGADIRSSTTLQVAVQEFDGSMLVPPTPGDYHAPIVGAPAPPLKSISAAMRATDASCQLLQFADVENGTVTLDALWVGLVSSMTGSFDLSFRGGGRGTGTFNAAICDADESVAFSTCR